MAFNEALRVSTDVWERDGERVVAHLQDKVVSAKNEAGWRSLPSLGALTGDKAWCFVTRRFHKQGEG